MHFRIFKEHVTQCLLASGIKFNSHLKISNKKHFWALYAHKFWEVVIEIQKETCNDKDFNEEYYKESIKELIFYAVGYYDKNKSTMFTYWENKRGYIPKFGRWAYKTITNYDSLDEKYVLKSLYDVIFWYNRTFEKQESLNSFIGNKFLNYFKKD